jgi:hypothetical protein
MPVGIRYSLASKYLLILLLIVGTISCRSPRKKYIIPKKIFVDVLVDIHLADGMAEENLGLNSTFLLDSATLYNSVFQKHKITRAQFDSTMHYYSKRPADFARLYSKVITRIKIMDEALKEPEKIELTGNEELIWKDPLVHSLPEMGRNDRIEISVPVSGPGEYIVSAKIKMYNDDASTTPRMVLYYYYDNKTSRGHREYFKVIRLVKDEKQNTYLTAKVLTDAKVTHIKGFIADHGNTDTLFTKHLQASEIKVLKRQPIETSTE